MSRLRKEYEEVFGVVEGALRLYDAKGNETYCEYSGGDWIKYQHDSEGNVIYRLYSDDGWRHQYDGRGNMIYYERSREGVMLDKRPCAGKVFIDEKTGKKFKMTETK